MRALHSLTTLATTVAIFACSSSSDTPAGPGPGTADGGDTGDAGVLTGTPTDLTVEQVTATAVPVTAFITTFSGALGSPTAGDLKSPIALSMTPQGEVIVADSVQAAIFRLGSNGQRQSVVQFGTPTGVAVNAAGLIAWSYPDGAVVRSWDGNANPTEAVLTGSGTPGFMNGPPSTAQLSEPRGLAVNAAGEFFLADAGNRRIRKIGANGAVTTLAGSGAAGADDGPATTATFSHPTAVAVDAAGTVYVADDASHKIRAVAPDGKVRTLAGSGTATFADGVGAAASFDFPRGIATFRGAVYVADMNNGRIRRIASTGAVTTLAGTGAGGGADGPGTTATFDAPAGIVFAPDGTLYVGDSASGRIRKAVLSGLGQIEVRWAKPATTPLVVSKYEVTAIAPGQPDKTCESTSAFTCTLEGLAPNVVYSISVTARSGSLIGPRSAVIGAAAN